ncbi:MAG: hypothetical protein ACPG45_06510 [Flavobacteriaceae bacterium]
MKKIIYLFIATIFLVSCNEDEMAPAYSDSGWIDFTSASSSAGDTVGSVDLEVAVNLGTNAEGQTITYSVDLVSGNANDMSVFGTFTAVIPSGEKMGYLPVGISTTDASGYEALVTLVSSSGMYDMGLPDDSKITEHTISVCQDVSMDLLANSITGYSELEGSGVEIYTPVLTPVAGESHVYTTTNIWGNFVQIVTGGAAPPIPYPGTLTVNSDLTVDFVGDSASRPGGTGYYDACTNEVFISLDQALFSGDFTVEVYLF